MLMLLPYGRPLLFSTCPKESRFDGIIPRGNKRKASFGPLLWGDGDDVLAQKRHLIRAGGSLLGACLRLVSLDI